MTQAAPFTIALAQARGIPEDVAANLASMARSARKAAELGCGLLILPELFLTGYNIGAALARLAQPLDGPAVRAVRRMARDHHIAILFGYPERVKNRIFNSALCIGPRGEVRANYRKTHLYGLERRHFIAGDELRITPLGPLQMGILICYDVEFSGAAAALARAGAHLIAVPTALMHPHAHVARRVVPARAYEHQLYIAYANRCGREGDLAYCGASCVVGPDGLDLARAQGEDPQLITAALDRTLLDAVRRENPLSTHQRPGLYRRSVSGAQPANSETSKR